MISCAVALSVGYDSWVLAQQTIYLVDQFDVLETLRIAPYAPLNEQ